MARTSDSHSSTSASTSPMVLTPSSTGTGFLDSLESAPSSPNPTARGGQETESPVPQGQGTGTGPRRRPTAFYPNLKSTTNTLKPFSRSAAKRESVLALGSIEHLQHYFTKTGLVAKKDPLDKPHYGLVPALGRAALFSSNPSTNTPTSTNALSTASSPSNGSSSDLSSLPEFVLPSAPDLPQPRRPSYVPNPNQPKTYEVDPDSLLPGVVDDLNAVSRAWEIDGDSSDEELDAAVCGGNQEGGSDRHPIVKVSKPSLSRSTSGNGRVDVLELLKTTTRAIRSTRNYLVSIPDESTLSPVTVKMEFRPSALGPGRLLVHHKGKASSKEKSKRKEPSEEGTETDGESNNWKRDTTGRWSKSLATHTNEKEKDTTDLVRKSALEVLATLRDVEERYRLPLTDEAYDAQSDGGVHHGARTQSPSLDSDLGRSSPQLHGRHLTYHSQSLHEGDLSSSIAYSLVPVQVGDRLEHVPVWEDDESSGDEFDEEKEKRELWDEKLDLGSGWLYRQDVKMEDMKKEREVVKRHLDVVDCVIFGGGRGVHDGDERQGRERRKERAWERERRKILTKNLRSRSKGRRVSGGPGAPETQSISTVLDEGRRRVSTGGIGTDMVTLTEEPESVGFGSSGSLGRNSHFGKLGLGRTGKFEDVGSLQEEEGESDSSAEDEDLPEWARKTSFVGDDLGRAHAFLRTFLPSHLVPLLDPAESRTDFLNSLSSGQLLCVAYNTCVRKSKKPWGYVNKDSIHDIVALEKAQGETEGHASPGGESSGRKGWTFRRTDNLRLWVGALKLRYLLPIQTPSHPLTESSLNSLKLLGQLQHSTSSGNLQAQLNATSISQRLQPSRSQQPYSNQGPSATPGLTPSHTPGTSPTKTRFASSDDPPIEFDARVVARKDEGWEEMVEKVLMRWMWKAVEEKRNLR